MAKNDIIILRVSKQQKERIIKLAELHELNTSEYLLYKALEPDIKNTPPEKIPKNVKKDFIQRLNPLRKNIM